MLIPAFVSDSESCDCEPKETVVHRLANFHAVYVQFSEFSILFFCKFLVLSFLLLKCHSCYWNVIPVTLLSSFGNRSDRKVLEKYYLLPIDHNSFWRQTTSVTLSSLYEMQQKSCGTHFSNFTCGNGNDCVSGHPLPCKAVAKIKIAWKQLWEQQWLHSHSSLRKWSLSSNSLALISGSIQFLWQGCFGFFFDSCYAAFFLKGNITIITSLWPK